MNTSETLKLSYPISAWDCVSYGKFQSRADERTYRAFWDGGTFTEFISGPYRRARLFCAECGQEGCQHDGRERD